LADLLVLALQLLRRESDEEKQALPPAPPRMPASAVRSFEGAEQAGDGTPAPLVRATMPEWRMA